MNNVSNVANGANAHPGRPSFPVIDAHTHLAWKECVPRQFVEASVANLHETLVARGVQVACSALCDRYMSTLEDAQGESLVAEMRGAGVVKAALLVPDFTYIAKGNLTIEELLRHHVEVARTHAGLFDVFAGVDPRWGKPGIDLFERSVKEWEIRGLKVYPPCGFEPSDRMMYPFYEICREFGLPVLVHIGPTSPWMAFHTSHPLALDQACRDFPTVKFILGHGGSHHVDDCFLMAAFRPNVYVELSGFQRGSGRQRTIAYLESLFARGINHKLLFGSDWPVHRAAMTETVDTVFGEPTAFPEVMERDLAMIAGGNYQRLFGQSASRRHAPQSSLTTAGEQV
jgi:predicted TIM-barrel fold metal-dependent hydrolase